MNLKIVVPSILFRTTAPFFMWLPSLWVRRIFLSIFLKKFGKYNYVARNVDIRWPRQISIGCNNVINKHTVLDGRGGLIIGDNVDIAQDVMIWTEQHDKDDSLHRTEAKTVIIEDYVWVASRAVILPGVHLKKGCVVGAGAVVTKEVKPLDVVAGIPAKVVSKRNNKLEYTLNFHPKFII